MAVLRSSSPKMVGFRAYHMKMAENVVQFFLKMYNLWRFKTQLYAQQSTKINYRQAGLQSSHEAVTEFW